MKRAFVLLLFLSLSACLTPPTTMLPVETAAALTLAAVPKSDTPLPAPTGTNTPTVPPLATTLAALDFSAPGSDCIPKNTERTKGLVTRVLDGDSIEVAIGNDAFRVRYIGIDAPGIVQPIEWKGPEAVNTNSNLVSGQIVILIKDISEVDSQGSLLRYVVVNNVFVNLELVHLGLAKVAVTPPDIACQETFLTAQAQAQAALIGVWQPTPIPTATITLTPTITPSPTITLRPVCDCKRTYTCTNFESISAAQACFDYCLATTGRQVIPDKNGNGKVCEGGVG